MDKRYQVFISSTFTDLRDERQSVLRAILELDHMPAGMELFPALDDSAWQLIKDVIDASDYYVLIVGGRYGSLDETGLGYTEKEYDYAISSKKPVIALLHENPDNLPRDKTETQGAAWKKLKAFKVKVEKQHTCVYWKNAEDLKAKVIVSLTATTKRHPAIGWIRADQVPSEATLSELLILRNKITELEANAEADKTKPPRGTEHLKQGTDTIEIHIEFTASKKVKGSSDALGIPTYESTSYSGSIEPSWNEVFAAIAPSMITEISDYYLRQSLYTFFEEFAKNAYKDDKDLKKSKLIDFSFRDDELDTCIVQLRALGLIQENLRQRSLKDTGTYWKLAPYGDYMMVQLRALSRELPKKAESTSIVAPSESTLDEK